MPESESTTTFNLSLLMRLFLPVLYLLLATSCLAHNNLFFPGDAYFPGKWTEDSPLATNETETVLRFSFRRDHDLMFCGYLGYEFLKIIGISSNMHANIQTMHKKMFEDWRPFAAKRITSPQDAGGGGDFFGVDPFGTVAPGTQQPPSTQLYFQVYIYARDFDFTELPIGIRFNEDWKSFQLKEGGRRHAIYPGVPDPEMVLTDWYSAEDVDPLPVRQMPDIKLDKGMGIKQPMEIEAKDIVFVVAPSGSLKDLAAHTEGLRFYTIGEEIAEYLCTSNGLVKRRLP